MTIRVVDIIEGTSVDGPGLRTAIYTAGCAHACPSCHNPSTWAFDAGRDYSPAELFECIKQNGFNVTFTGGDPMYQAKALIPLAGEIKRLGYNLWCYTGFTFEQLLRMTEPMELLQYIDVLVDGPYMEALRDTELRFRGSSNQRIIDVQHSLAAHIVVEDTRYD